MDKIRDYLYVGDYDDGTLEEMPEKIDFVVSLMGGGFQPQTDLWYPLKDGGNSEDRFNGAVENVLQAIERGDTVLVHCAMGQSRSPAVVATALAEKEDMSFEEALKEVEEVRPIANPVQVLKKLGKKYLNGWER